MKKICKCCGKEFETTNGTKKFCTSLCQKVYETITKFPNGTDYVECKECGFRGNRIDRHIKAEHNMTVVEYCEKYHLSKIDLFSKSSRERNSNAQKKLYENGRVSLFMTENNPSKGVACKNGRNSPYSMNFREYDGMTNEEKKEKIKLLKSQGVVKKKENHNDPLTVEYYIKRGYTRDEAEDMLANRQTTFSLDICIEKYGEEEGTKRWQERQEKWLASYNDKSDEEMERINRAKNFDGKGYSNISQEVFWDLYNKVKVDYKNIYFATLDKETKEYTEMNNEYFVRDGSKCFFLDFYVKDINKVIEFDGDYWHNQNLPGNKEREETRDNALKELGYNILHIKERDYKNDKEKVLQECLDFLKS